MNQPEQDAQQFREILQKKIRRLLDDFAAGKLSREQFHMLYERYNARLAITDHALMSGNPDAVAIAQTGPSTLQILQETSARALGLVIYHNKESALIETLGNFEVADDALQSILKKYIPVKPFVVHTREPIHQVGAKQWLYFAIGKYTTAITLFTNEPSKQQIREIDRLHGDFEMANRGTLTYASIDADKLAYPFVVFVKQKLKK